MPTRTTVRLPEDLVVRAKRKAADEGVSMTGLIEEGLRRVLNEDKAQTRSARVLPPVSAANGGLVPGADLNDTAAIEEMDDLDRFDRAQ
jgi:hypothetical protein